jgi:hypothetical protein
MLYFLTPSALLNSMGMAETPDFLAAAAAALDTATLCLSSDLRSDFDLVSGQVDTFMPNPNDPSKKFKLLYGFMSTDPNNAPVVTQYSSYESLTQYQGTTIMPFANTDPLLTASAILTPNCTFDYVRGVVTVNNVCFDGQIITIQYTSGFGVDANDDTLYDQTLVPPWLIALANLRARIDLSAHPAFIDSKAIYNPKGLQENYGTICARRSRVVPDAILPV